MAYRRVDFANCANLKNLRDQLQRRLLGILGLQLAQKLGYKVAAIEHGPEDSVLAKKLGASVYIDSAAKQRSSRATETRWRPRHSCQRAPSSKAMSSTLADKGTMVVAGAAPSRSKSPPPSSSSQEKHPGLAVSNPHQLERHAPLRRIDRFAMIEKYPLARAGEAPHDEQSSLPSPADLVSKIGAGLNSR